MRDLRVGAVGRIVGGDTEVGRLVQIVDDAERTGGYLIVTTSGEDGQPETFDTWAPSIVDVEIQLDNWNWQIEWL